MGLGSGLGIPLKYEHGVWRHPMLIWWMLVSLHRRLHAQHAPASPVLIFEAYEDILVTRHPHTTIHIASALAASSSLFIML